MKNSKLLTIATCAYAFCALALSFAPPAKAASLTYNFRQDGFQNPFERGAYVEGFFVAEDLDGDGQIVYFNSTGGEVSDFRVTFSGTRSIPPATYGFGDLFGLVYNLDGGPLGDTDGYNGPLEGISTGRLTRFGDPGYYAGPGPFTTVQIHATEPRICNGDDGLCGVLVVLLLLRLTLLSFLHLSLSLSLNLIPSWGALWLSVSVSYSKDNNRVEPISRNLIASRSLFVSVKTLPRHFLLTFLRDEKRSQAIMEPQTFSPQASFTERSSECLLHDPRQHLLPNLWARDALPPLPAVNASPDPHGYLSLPTAWSL